MPTSMSDTVIPVADPSRLMGFFIDHIRDEHGIVFDEADDGSRIFRQDEFGLRFHVLPSGLQVRIEGPNPGVLIFFKEEIVSHVAELDPTAAANIRWSGETAVAGALPSNFKVLEVTASREVFAGMQRVTLVHDDVVSLADGGIHLRLMLPLEPGRVPVWPRMAENGVPVWPGGADKLHARMITLRHVRPSEGEVDIDIVRHAGGLISDWAQQAREGQRVGVMGPAGKVTLPVFDGLFLAADGTGLPALARLLESLPAAATGDVVVAFPPDADATDYLPQTPLRVHKIAPDRFEGEVVQRAAALTARGRTGYAFFAGEFQNAQDLRAHFKAELGLDKTTQISAAYWRRGVPGYGS
ncbi:MAG: siderophore-interacting protein [Pseudomonadota bacterium]